MLKKSRLKHSITLLTLLVCLMVGLFWLIFDLSKHLPILAAVSPFGEDPYDAVGSFGIQLGFLSVILAVLRVIRPQEISGHDLQTLLNAHAVALTSIVVTMFADLTALARFPDQWIHAPTGWILLGLVCGLLVAACLAGWWLYWLEKSLEFFPSSDANIRHRGQALVGLVAGLILLFFYPPSWRIGVMGGLFTALLGMALLFVLTALVLRGWKSPARTPNQDSLDDLLAVYRWVKYHVQFCDPLFSRLERLFSTPWARRGLAWLNPRRRPWNMVVFAGILLGTGLVIAEFFREGMAENRILLLIAVFLGIESGGVLLGFLLLNPILGILRLEKIDR